MTALLTPGVYFERPIRRRPDARPPTDVAGFVGIARRGPLHCPVRITSWRQFQEVFGTFAPYANLAYAARGFFENGGRTCWIVRVAHADAARGASTVVPDEGGHAAYRVTATSPGVWANDLSVQVLADQLATTRHDPTVALGAGQWLAVESVAGLEEGSRVRLTQRQVRGAEIRRVEEVDTFRGLVRLDIDVAPLPVDAEPIAVESIEFTIVVLEYGQPVERHAGLAPDPAHSRAAVQRVNGASTLIRLQQLDTIAVPTAPWGGPNDGLLSGGTDGLRDLGVRDLTGFNREEPRGIEALAKIDEVAILAMPDLVAPEIAPAAQRVRLPPLDQCDARLLDAGDDVDGTILDDETNEPLDDVHIRVGGHDIISADGGAFTIPGGFLEGGADVYFEVDGYDPERRVMAASAPDLVVRLHLFEGPDVPPGLDDDGVHFVQSQMVSQCERLRDRFCLIEAPYRNGADVDIGPVRGWRARFDSSFVALYYPWIVVRDPLRPLAVSGRAIPPCGHIAGSYAATDLEARGAHRPPANRLLRHVENAVDDLDDARHGVLNPLGINAIRARPGRGIRALGARTLSSDSAWRFVNVRRFMSAMEEQIADGLQWAVFEPHDQGLRLAISMWLTHLADDHWRRGALVGATPEEAYAVRCDDTTMSADDVTNGRLIAVLAVAPTVPYEFIVIRLGLTRNELRVSEVVT